MFPTTSLHGLFLRRLIVGSFLLGTLLVPSTPIQAQTNGGDGDDRSLLFPRHGFLVTGYGSAGYRATFADGETPNNFRASLSPILLWQIADRFLFESELEFALEEGVTEAELEYAQIDYSLTNNAKVVAGKFLLPFNIFTERMHPTWINSFISPPALYGGHHGSAGPVEPMLPVLSDVGVQVRGTYTLGRFSYLTVSGFVSQGPRAEVGDEEVGHEDEEEDHEEDHVPELEFGTNFEDNNEDKMVGGRLGAGIAPYFEANVSAMTGAYDAAGDLRFTSYGAHLEGRYAGFELHGEWMRTEQEVAEEESGEIETLDRDGYWVQLSYRHRKWEPEVRWTQLFEGQLHEETVMEDGRQLALGLAYWMEPSLGLKIEYLFNGEDADLDNDRFALQWAFGF